VPGETVTPPGKVDVAVTLYVAAREVMFVNVRVVVTLPGKDASYTDGSFRSTR
jgi:hypothetical protein